MYVSKLLIHSSLVSAFPRAVLSPLSMPWPTTYSVSQQPVACTEPDTSPSQTTLPPTQQLWPPCRRTQRWQPQHMADTQATRCHRPSPPRPSSCPSTMSTRHTDSEGQTNTLPVTEPPTQRLSHHAETSLELVNIQKEGSKYLENGETMTSYMCPTCWPQCILDPRQP